MDGIHAVERAVGNLFSPIFGGPVASGSNDKVSLKLIDNIRLF